VLNGSENEARNPSAALTLTYAHQGCFLALPDLGFYADTPPYVDAAALERDAALLEKEIEGAAALGCVAFVQLMSAVDDFVAYEWLGHPAREVRRVRAEALARVQWRLVEKAHALGLEYYVQTYELLLDQWVAKRATLDGITELLEAKYGEFFRRVGADGIFVTPSEAHPRGTVVWRDLWKGKAGVARMAHAFHEAIVCRLGRKLVLRLWLAAETEAEWAALRCSLPEGLPLCVKNTAADFWNQVPLNPALRHPLRGHPLHVIFDVFGQYHGWGKLLYFDSLWEPSLAACARVGATMQLWGSWSPSCIWPNHAPDDLNSPQPVAWAGCSRDDGLWTPDHLGGQLSMRWLAARVRGAGAQAALYQATSACGLPAGDTDPLWRAFPVVMRLWDEMHTVHRGSLVPLLHQWATIYQSPRKTWRDLLADGGRAGILASNRHVDVGLEALRTIGRTVADADLRRVWERTILYFETFRRAREAACQDPRFAGGTGVAAEVLRRLRDCLRRWEAFPPENCDWGLTGVSPRKFPARKRWLRAETLAQYVEKLERGQTDPVPEGRPWSWQTWNGR
jgi:hypothetical protein